MIFFKEQTYNITIFLFNTVWLLFITDNEMMKTTTSKTQSNVTIVNELNPVHHCINAFQRDSKCDYALCNNCKNEIENQEFQGSVKRTRSAYRNSNENAKSDNIGSLKKATEKYQNVSSRTNNEVDEDCDHNIHGLKFTVDKTNFETSFLFQVKKMKRNYPINCNRCHVEFRNK